jgi:hypothetical protein
MTRQTGNFSPPPSNQYDRPTSDVAKEQAAEVGQTAAEGGQHVAKVAAGQAREVTAEAGRQASDLLDQGREQLQQQARSSQAKAAEGLHGLADQLQGMTEQSDQSGMAGDLVRDVASRTRKVASWLDSREPGDLLDEVRGFARRKPGLFLAGAAIAGVLAGRLTRGVAQGSQESGSAPQQQGAVPHQEPRDVAPSYQAPPSPVTAPPPGAHRGGQAAPYGTGPA